MRKRKTTPTINKDGKTRKQNTIRVKQTNEQIFKPLAKKSSSTKHFCDISYYDTSVTHNSDLDHVEVCGIILDVQDKNIRFLNLSNPECKPEYREKLKQWDKSVILVYWCAINNIPWWRFTKCILKRQVIRVKGTVKTFKNRKPKTRHVRPKAIHAVNKIYDFTKEA